MQEFLETLQMEDIVMRDKRQADWNTYSSNRQVDRQIQKTNGLRTDMTGHSLPSSSSPLQKQASPSLCPECS